MTLAEINQLWTEYKRKYDIDSDAMIEAVEFDAAENVEGFFNIMELLDGQYIIHLNSNIHIYDDDYVKFILFHEFTHFYDFINRPYDHGEKLFLYMNAYSEFHACRVTLARSIEQFRVDVVNVDKLQIPGPYREMSIRTLLEDTLWRAKIGFEYYYDSMLPTEYASAFRVLMYLFGYLSLFKQDEELVRASMKVTQQEDERIFELYQALKDTDIDAVVEIYKNIGNDVVLRYLREMFRRYYGDLLSEDEIEAITVDNYQDLLKKLEEIDGDIEEESDSKGTPLEQDVACEISACISLLMTGKLA